tara:strand:- start:143 stop:1021 length:879 start_codon:yes stop_codon:yes gene_type:complete
MSEASEMMSQRYEDLIQEVGPDNIQMLSEAQLFAGRDEYIANLLSTNSAARLEFDSDKAFLESITKSMENVQASASKVYTGDMDHITYMNKDKARLATLISNRDVMVRKKDGSFTNNLNDALKRLAETNKGISVTDLNDSIKNGDYSYVGTTAQGHRAGSMMLQIRTDNGSVMMEVANNDQVMKTFEDAGEVYNIAINGYSGSHTMTSDVGPDGSISKSTISYKYDHMRDKTGKIIEGAPMDFYPVVHIVKTDSNGQITQNTYQHANLLDEMYDQAYNAAELTNAKSVPRGM